MIWRYLYQRTWETLPLDLRSQTSPWRKFKRKRTPSCCYSVYNCAHRARMEEEARASWNDCLSSALHLRLLNSGISWSMTFGLLLGMLLSYGRVNVLNEVLTLRLGIFKRSSIEGVYWRCSCKEDFSDCCGNPTVSS